MRDAMPCLYHAFCRVCKLFLRFVWRTAIPKRQYQPDPVCAPGNQRRAQRGHSRQSAGPARGCLAWRQLVNHPQLPPAAACLNGCHARTVAQKKNQKNIKKVLTNTRNACNNTAHGQAIKQVPYASGSRQEKQNGQQYPERSNTFKRI